MAQDELARRGIDFFPCESVPELCPNHRLINDAGRGATPILDVPRGFRDEIGAIFAVFAAHLRPR